MPCKKGMAGCSRSCGHWQFVTDYHVARHSQLVEEEAATNLDPHMLTERRENGTRPIVFKEWLVGHGNTDRAGNDDGAWDDEDAFPSYDAEAW